MNKRYQFSYRFKQVLTLAIYITFFMFIVRNIISATDNSSRLFNILILILCGLPALLYEYLRYTYDAATKKTIFDGQADKALLDIEKIEKYDLLKMFKTSCVMLRMLCLRDLRKFQELKEYINEIDKQELNDYDVAILSRYSEMIVNGEMKAKGKLKNAYKKMIDLRDMKNKKGQRRKGAYFFNWNVVNGEYKLYEEDYSGAWHYLKDVSEENMNKRESMHYFINRAICSKQMNKQEDYKTYKERAIKAAGDNQEMKAYIETI